MDGRSISSKWIYAAMICPEHEVENCKICYRDAPDKALFVLYADKTNVILEEYYNVIAASNPMSIPESLLLFASYIITSIVKNAVHDRNLQIEFFDELVLITAMAILEKDNK